MRLRPFVVLTSLVSSLALAGLGGTAQAADDAQGFIQREHEKIERLLHQPPSSSRDTEVNHALDTFVDYEELTRRAFGEPCHPSLPNCEDLWSQYNDQQKSELHDLLRQLVQKSYRKNLLKTLDYDIDYRGQHDVGSDTRVSTEAKNKQKPRDPSVRVDYVVEQTPSGFRVVDIVTEGSSLSKNYYEQFRKKMDNPNEGYRNIVQKLKDKIAKRD
jgi:phospholipid transport system substrate-binding protein